MYRRRGGSNLGLLLLAWRLMNAGPLPPVTMVMLIVNVSAYLLPQSGLSYQLYQSPGIPLQKLLMYLAPNTACISYVHVVVAGQWMRMLASSFVHLDDFHLYYNMSSLAYKGREIESRVGGEGFARMLAFLMIVGNALYLAASYALADVTGDPSYLSTCAAGFSGVLFGLKVVLARYYPHGTSSVMGFIRVPSKHVFWAELLLIQLITPHVSFVGHLCGILAGLVYTELDRSALADAFLQAVRRQRPSYEPRFASAGQTGLRQRDAQQQHHHHPDAVAEEDHVVARRAAAVRAAERRAAGMRYRG